MVRLVLALFFLGVGTFLAAAHLVLFAGAARRARLAVSTYSLGIGPRLLRLGGASGAIFELRAILWSGFALPVRRVDPGFIEIPGPVAARVERGELRCFDDVPAPLRVALCAISVALALTVACALLGPRDGLGASVEGARLFLLGAFGPARDTFAAFDRAWLEYRALGPLHVLGASAAIFGGIELLNVPSALAYAAKPSGPAVAKVRALIVFAMWGLQVLWAIAFVRWVLRAA